MAAIEGGLSRGSGDNGSGDPTPAGLQMQLGDNDGPLIVAIDGPAGAGKSTVGIRLAERLGATFVDTGIFYRVVTLLALERGVDIADARAVAEIARSLSLHIQGPSRDDPVGAVLVAGRSLGHELRSPDVDANVSLVAGYGEVREALVAPQQRAFAGGRAVVVGRDIGTVICPDADAKIYLEASRDERARRRAEQMGHSLPFDEVRASVDRRDELDRTRAVAPLEAAPDAIVLDTDGVPIDDVVDRIQQMVAAREEHRRA
jgi:cytidylate kinase